MRILNGQWRGRSYTFKRVKPGMIRPTTSFAKEGLINVLRHNYQVDDVHVLDLFAGTGSISFELLSIGVASVHLVEQSRHLCQQIREFANQIGIASSRLVIHPMLVSNYLRRHTDGLSYDIVFADPPFRYAEKRQLFQRIVYGEVLKRQGGVFIFEHASTDKELESIPISQKRYAYGDVSFTIFEAQHIYE